MVAEQARALGRVLWLARPLRARLLAAVLAGAVATGCGVALLAVSGFILAQASQHPSIIAISVAVVAVRGLSIVRGVGPQLTAALVGAGATTCCLLILAPAGGVLAAGLLAAGVLVPWLGASVARRAGRRTATARGELGATISELLTGAADLQAFGADGAALERFRAADAELTGLARRSAVAAGVGTGLTAAVSGMTVWGVLLLGVGAVSGGTLTMVPLAVVTLTALAAFEAVTPLPAAAIALGQSIGSARRIGQVLDTPAPVIDPAVRRRLPGGPASIQLRGAQVRYRPDGPLALDGLDLDLPPGRRVALVGPSGAGKSTAAAVLLRFCELAAGSATLGGHQLSDYAADETRSVIGGCAQDPHIFDASIRDNLRLARPDAADAELVEAARRVRLLDWIESLPHGWDTGAGARGVALSGGQRQRLALARALLADPSVVVFDEPTAHLDRETRRSITADLLAATQGHATLLITHELDGLDQVDEIVVLDGGVVVERGTHHQLLQARGWYWQMWQLSGPLGCSPAPGGADAARPGIRWWQAG